jgi:hypothetical protein
MFGFDLQPSEWVAVIGAAYLAARLLYGIGRVIWWYVSDAKRATAVHRYSPMLTGLMVGAMSVALLLLAVNMPLGQLGILTIAASVAVGVTGFFIGAMFDVIIDFRLLNLSNWLMSFRVPGYREQLMHGDDTVRLAAAERLAQLGTYAIPARPELFAAFKDESADVRAMAFQAVSHWITDPPAADDTETVKEARPALHDPDIRVRVFAMAILSTFKAATAEEMLPTLCAALTHPDADTASVAARILERLGPGAEPAIPALQNAVLEQKNPNLSAITALGKIGAPAVPALTYIFERGNTICMLFAASALGEMGETGRAALPVLRAATHNTDLNTKQAAKRAIKKIGGERG